MMYSKDFSVIVPVWRGAIKFLPKLFDSIPEKEGIEIPFNYVNVVMKENG